MTKLAMSIALAAVMAASSALAQADPHAGHHPDSPVAQAAAAKPEAAPPAEGEGCKMMKGMMRDQPRGPAGDAAKGEDGQRSAAGGMKCMSPAQSAANDDHGHDRGAAKTK